MKQFDLSDLDEHHSHNDEYQTLTHYVPLPSAGRFYGPSHDLHGLEKIEIKMMTTKEEDVLTNSSYIEEGNVLEKFLESIIINKKIKVKDLFDGDQLAILHAARREAYGDEYHITVTCSICQCSNEHTINLSDSKIKEPDGSDVEMTPDDTLAVKLPKTNKLVEFKYLTPRELENINKSLEAKRKHKIDTNFLKEMYLKMVLSVDGETNKEKISQFVDNMPIKDSRFLQKTYNDNSPGIDLNYSFKCQKCKNELEGGVPLQGDFFWPKL